MSNALLGVIHGGGVWVRVGMGGVIQSSTDGVSWTTRNSGVVSNLTAVAYGNSMFMVVGTDGVVLVSTDGFLWTSVDPGTTQHLLDVVFADVFMVVGGNRADDSFMASTVFGTAWAVIPTGTTSPLRSISVNNGAYVVVGDNDVIIRGTTSVGQLNVGITETFGFREGVDNANTTKPVVSDTLGLIGDTWHDEERRILRETIYAYLGFYHDGIAGTQKAVQVEAATMGLTSRVVPSETIFESLGLTDAVVYGLGMNLIDALGLGDGITFTTDMNEIIGETLGVNDLIQDQLTMVIVNAETLGLADTVLSNQLFRLIIDDGIGFGAHLFIAGEEYIGWVINTKNLAVSKYLKYEFNSFARFEGKYYGANENGIFDLSSETDDGTDIVTAIKTGLMNFGSEFQKRIPRAYIGVRNDDRVILKTITNEGIERWYELAETHSGLSRARFKLSKGVKSAYWQFELTTIGPAQIEALTLMPIVLTRRPK